MNKIPSQVFCPSASPSSFLSILSVCRSCFTEPTFRIFCLIACGWISTPGHWAVTACLVVTGMSGQRHHSAFHRFFAESKWSIDEVGRTIFNFLCERVIPRDVSIQFVIDDSLAKKRGKNIFGLGTHIDAVNSTRGWRIFAFGHCWVVLSIVVWFPWSNRPWALPVAFRLYRQKKTIEAERDYKKKTELAAELIALLRSWAPDDRRLNGLVDEAYFNATTLKTLPDNVHLIGAIRPDAVLTAGVRGSKHANGRPRVRGERLPKPKEIAQGSSRPWMTVACSIYRTVEEVTYKYLHAQWYRGAGARLMAFVIVKSRCGEIPFRVYVSTDPSLSAKQMIELFACRWPTEQTFRDLKQYLGFSAPQSRTPLAVERTAPLVGMLYSLCVVWFHLHVAGTNTPIFPIRPWYTKKRHPSFPDILGVAQRAAMQSGVFDPANNSNNLQNPNGAPSVVPYRTPEESPRG